MVNIIKRMTKLRALLGIRLGPGAAILPPEVERIHMDFAFEMNDGHMGPRKFWRGCLPRLKYHNPAVPMTVNRTTDQTGPALMTVTFTSSTTPSTQEINMKHRTDSEILAQLIQLTKAKPVHATPEEQQQLKDMAEQRARSEKDAELRARVNAERRREQAILTQARGEVAAATSEA